ncbi:hypothetical protein, variant 2 [Aphanomyces astaci]|uniref:Uncharacterized protein n=1 Tax=Aphanomyces astaci TaxID=112090 RepID=W4G5N3_APHAT|nr:hypothetical protein, variant 2 [Aphanomyces astaci]ETV74238.1 hypothetical protein, variant 2 [Aphanomyces astaci]|eukprot:XP_009836347.1 hypothetical protein, variant 2 [Aphanomyces astaci]
MRWQSSSSSSKNSTRAEMAVLVLSIMRCILSRRLIRRVDANELSTLMESMNIHMEKAELLSLIAIVDENGSGQIEFNEFVLMMSNLRRGKSNKLSKFVQMSKQAFQIRQEFHALDDNPVKGCRVVPFKQDMRQWTVFLQGPADTPYDGGVFRFHFQFGHDYPYEPPIVSLQTRIYHVNFIMLLDGTAPTEWLASMWTPDWRSRTLLERLVLLFRDPKPELMIPIYNARDAPPTVGTTARSFGIDCFNQFVEHPDEFVRIATEITKQYATPPPSV